MSSGTILALKKDSKKLHDSPCIDFNKSGSLIPNHDHTWSIMSSLFVYILAAEKLED